jgi:hypothetical protein
LRRSPETRRNTFTLAAPITFTCLPTHFGFTAVQGTFATMREQSPTSRIGQGLHLAVSFVMLAMVPVVWRPLVSVINA